MAVNLTIKTHKQEGDLAHEYNPLRNIIDSNNQVTEFDVDAEEFPVDLHNPLSIECQPAYDGTVNLIINDDTNPPRIINTRFSKLEDNKYKVINRNQLEQTNLYREGNVDQQTRLFRNIRRIPRFDLVNMYNMGQLKGGNYTFYAKLSDCDYNKTDFVCESGQISIFKGRINSPESISGAIANEVTDKAISLRISNLDPSFSYVYLYYSREYCDLNGIRMSECGMYTKPFEIKTNVINITLTGYEETQTISEEEINLQYNAVTATKTQAQVQNMLFFGNVQQTSVKIKELQNLAYFLPVTLNQGQSVGWLSENDYKTKSGDDLSQVEYYNANNIYYKLGYWPDEIYRLGIVFIMKDDSITPVFNLRGCEIAGIGSGNDISDKDLYDSEGNIQYVPRNEFLNNVNYSNTYGIFKNPNVAVIDNTKQEVKPLYYTITIGTNVKSELKKLGVKGYFVVRQKRIPTTLGQGFSVGVDRSCYIPMLYDTTKSAYIAEGFIDTNKKLSPTYETRIKKVSVKQCSGLLSLDAMCVPTLQAMFNGSSFPLRKSISYSSLISSKRHYYPYDGTNEKNARVIGAGAVYVRSDTPVKFINNYAYSTRCGSAEDVSEFGFFGTRNETKENTDLLRGIWSPFIGLDVSLDDNCIYDIKVPNYSTAMMKEYFTIRANDNSPFFAITDRYALDDVADDKSNIINVYRGDCYSNTVTIRMHRNFTDSEVPISDTIIDEDTWSANYKGMNKTIKNRGDDLKDDEGSWEDINRADINTVPIGTWITFKCLSNYNLGLRAEDSQHVDEAALMGSNRGFYPLFGMSTNSSMKIPESTLLNEGYGATVGKRRAFAAPDVPYIKELFDNRIMFSNMQVNGAFENGYRVFQGLSYQDIDRQYGGIVKLMPWGVNLLCVFEHGIGIVPVNEKALVQTTAGQSVHMYGAGVLQSQISVITPDFGTIWAESIIRTPIGIYGVDTTAKRIWRYSDSKGFETISDMKVQRFLNDHIKLAEADKYPIIGIKNVKSHYNNYKGDVMFTFYNEDKEETWNLCYNERMGKWITRYSWTPLYSENINNIFYSMDQDRTRVLSCIYDNLHALYGLTVYSGDSEWNTTNNIHQIRTILKGYDLAEDYTLSIKSIETSYLDQDSNEIKIKLTDSNEISQVFTINSHNIVSGNYASVKQFFNTKYNAHMPLYFIIKVLVTMHIGTAISSFVETIGLVLDDQKAFAADKELYSLRRNAFLKNGMYVHGRAGIFDEINYDNDDFDRLDDGDLSDDQILPCKWYEKQEPFEFEFVVNGEIGLHKIFDNLVIISNNVQPNEIEYEITGDVYHFNKAGIYRAFKDPSNADRKLWDPRTNKPVVAIDKFGIKRKYQSTQEFTNCEVKWDNHLNEYSLITKQPCKNIRSYGRRLGNIEYKEDSWYLTIDPIKFREKHRIYEDPNSIGRHDQYTPPLTGFKEDNWSDLKTTRQRDKYIKIRVKYTGQDAVIITALKTALTQSFA